MGGHAAPTAHGAPMNACCVVPSITTGLVTLGSVCKGAIVNDGPAPGILKAIVLVEPAFRFASVIACRSDPGPPSLRLVTVYVRAPAITCVAALVVLLPGAGSGSVARAVAVFVRVPAA